MMPKRLGWVLGAWLVTSCVGGESGGGGGGGKCGQVAEHYRACGVLTPGALEDCTAEVADAQACEVACLLEAQCADVSSYACSGTEGLELSSGLAQCFEACKTATCDDGTPIAPHALCDGISECNDNSDEIGCTNVFTCDDGDTIPNDWKCDGVDDCFDGEDELGCPTFRCDNGELVPAGHRCDGEESCADGSDENGCPTIADFICAD